MKAQLRFYDDLNDFLPRVHRHQEVIFQTFQPTTVKDAIESLGVPHTEIDLILVNGNSRPFTYLVKDGDRVSVYPMFEEIDVGDVTLLRQDPLRNQRDDPKFIVDVNLGKLAHLLRMMGFDVIYDRWLQDDVEIARISKFENRLLLTRDRNLLKRREVDRGYFVRSDIPQEQLLEVMKRYDLGGETQLCSRCIHDNTPLEPIAKEQILDQVPPLVAETYSEFSICPDCQRVYWEGSHFESMKNLRDGVVRFLAG
ncbi:Mut7-C RNAse domain-containing protein [Bdellovibrio sp. GT3]|uniref:Mut7-C RNAse domain-containing protein n=1 Tax=Bdellovibrio sp. GT3 TaxID=3136282 RepID=UPI0030F1896C